MTSPLLMADGTLHQFTLKIGGSPYRCECGCNVFHHPDKDDLNLWQCNGCEKQFETSES